MTIASNPAILSVFGIATFSSDRAFRAFRAFNSNSSPIPAAGGRGGGCGRYSARLRRDGSAAGVYEKRVPAGECPPSTGQYEYTFTPEIEAECPAAINTGPVTAISKVTDVNMPVPEFVPYKHLWPKCLVAPVSLSDFLITMPEGAPAVEWELREVSKKKYELWGCGKMVVEASVTRHQHSCGGEYGYSGPGPTRNDSNTIGPRDVLFGSTAPDKYLDLKDVDTIKGAPWALVKETRYTNQGIDIAITITAAKTAPALTIILTFGSFKLSIPIGSTYPSVPSWQAKYPKGETNIQAKAYIEPVPNSGISSARRCCRRSRGWPPRRIAAGGPWLDPGWAIFRPFAAFRGEHRWPRCGVRRIVRVPSCSVLRRRARCRRLRGPLRQRRAGPAARGCALGSPRPPNGPGPGGCAPGSGHAGTGA